MNFSMWRKALQVIPRISKEEWDKLDIVSRWLIATRAAVSDHDLHLRRYCRNTGLSARGF